MKDVTEHALLILSTPEQFKELDRFTKKWNMSRERTAQALLALGIELADSAEKRKQLTLGGDGSR
jgi:hypothetical protein